MKEVIIGAAIVGGVLLLIVGGLVISQGEPDKLLAKQEDIRKLRRELRFQQREKKRLLTTAETKENN